MTHVHLHPHHGRGAAAALASTWNALCCLSATHPWFWLVRPGAPGGFVAKIIELGAYAPGAAAPLGLVLLDGLPRLLDALGAGALGHG
jgi:hypothetical protein